MPPCQPLSPTDVGLVLSYQCPNACKHCAYNCGPDWQDWFPPQALFPALEVIRHLNTDIQVHITGGEPFLNFPLLIQAVSTARSLHLPVYAETSAEWCLSASIAEQRFQALRQAGLQAVLISCSPFHAEKVPLKRTLIAIEVAYEVFGPERVMVYTSDWIEQIWHFGLENPVSINQYVMAYGGEAAGLMFWDGYGLVSGGRAGYTLGRLTDQSPADAFAADSCSAELLFAARTLVDLYGNFIPGYCGGLSAGSWQFAADLRASFQAGIFPDLIAVLVELGPYGLFALATEKYQYTPLPSGYAGKCHLCVDVRRHLFCKAADHFPELRPAAFYTQF